MNKVDESNPVAYFISFIGPYYSRSGTLLNFKSKYFEKEFIRVGSRFSNLIRDLTRLREELNNNSVIIIMSPAHKVTILAKIILRKKIILDAGWPLTDGVLSRGFKISKSFKLSKSFILDFVSFQIADLVLAETFSQADRIHRIYQVPRKKIEVSYTGLNEVAFIAQKRKSIKVQNLKSQLKLNSNAITILFRGKINNESGIDTIISSANDLSTEANFIFLTGKENTLKSLSSNCFLVSDVNEDEMAQIYRLADVALGQISNHRRLKYTIPHKAYEAGYFGKCYVTARSRGLLEIFSQNECYFLEEATPEALKSAIRSLRDSNLRSEYEVAISKTYERKISQQEINLSFEKLVLRYLK